MGYTITWQPTGASSAITLADISQKWVPTIEQLGTTGIEQVEPIFRATNPQRIPRGNFAGDCIFSSAQNFATRAAAAAFFKGQISLIQLGTTGTTAYPTGTLIITIDTTTFTMGLATFRALALMKMEGLRWTLRYTFGITTIT